jgi:hypothetical protein
LRLTQVTTDLPRRIIAQEDIIFIIKLDSLTHNFMSMIVALHQMFQEIKNTNEKLEAIVEIRTQELSVINEELAPEVVQ